MNRRHFLRGMLGGTAVTVGLPWLEAHAACDGFPVRFGLFFWGNGTLPDFWIPTGTGDGDAWSLSEQLSALATVKTSLCVATGMTVKVPNIIPHGSGLAGFLAGTEQIVEGDSGTFKGPGIDQIIAAEIGGLTRFRSIEFGVDAGSGISFNGPHSTNPPEESPYGLFERIFGTGFTLPGDEPIIDPKLALRRSVLDAVLEDANRLKARVGANDKIRLEQHMDGIRDLEHRLAILEDDPPQMDSCSMPVTPDADYPDIEGRPQLSARNRAMVDLVVMALACDQVRVFTDMFGHPVGNTLYPDATAGHHTLTHDEPGDQPQVNAIVKYVIAEYAYLLEAMRAIPEGPGTLLDHSVVLGTSEVSLGRTHALDEFPVLIGGSACGWFKQDHHYRGVDENASKVMLSILRSVGINAGSFGEGDAGETEGLSGIEA